ncbi:GNAT family N-acetyltransferase [Romboutsia ilealis]|uniref:GNAT family N-acetyltransferase n=1 Tax=Romboutsia faecis TaxID=2764597 RepID=A0ABR7JS11_9FIRM|nr:GNAT family N-acetyltransferase [Romboutsia faecis]MBC5997696.1 GNAT family N-acetyltransferase [Romboutsia faecis]MRN25356.1 GNAT family N-acetyltransferase [Romboutsia ilealis]
MGHIKLYKNLNEYEKKSVYEFMKLETDYINSFDEINKLYDSKIYDYGNGALFYFIDNKVVANLCLVLEVAKVLKSAYIHKIVLNKEIVNINEILEELIQKSILIAKGYKVSNLKLGLDENTFNHLKRYGFNYEYRAIEMKLEETIKKYETLSLKELSHFNKERYVEIYNDSFSDMPHGTFIEIEDVNELLENNKDKEIYSFIVHDNDIEIGFMEISIENNKGKFDIGLMKNYRGKGYGNRILETAIQFLVNKKVSEIALVVIEENKLAHKIYKKRGFIDNFVIGYWSNLII